jgi:signal transduction histidine kinase
VVPVLAGERVIAALGLHFDEPRAVSAETRDFLATLGEVAGQALERARLYAAESDARAEAERARRDAEAANAAKSDFLAVMSHELRTPLNAIAGYTQLLELGVRGPVTAGQLEDLARIQRSQRHLLGLINDVLNFARLDAGRVEYHMESVPVAELLLHATEIIAPQTEARSITFHAASADGLAVHADREKVQQVLLNLLANAARFTPPGGRIEVDTDRDGGMVLLHVRDTGPGIPHDQWERVFEPFVQLGRSRSTPGEGSGLGLAISRDLARGMGGDLTVTSVVGNGACFTLGLMGMPPVAAG